LKRLGRDSLHGEHATGALNRLGHMALLGGGEAGQLAGQNLAGLRDITGEGLGLGEIEVEGVLGPISVTCSRHGRV